MNPERYIERMLFASRWLLCPLYLGLAVVLIVVGIHFFKELFGLAVGALDLTGKDVIIGALNLIDLTLVAGLVVMVMLSSYENFVSKMDVAEARASIAWLGKLDTGTLKLKVAASIIAISAIQLLKWFMEVESIANDKLMWMVIIHLTFVVSALLLAVTDRLQAASREGHSAETTEVAAPANSLG